jgi:predicted O-methyltransferase YrrM
VGKISFLLKYISYIFSAKDEHSLHSPFVFDLYINTIKPKKRFYVFSKIEKLRKELHESKKEITITEYGAGSKVNSSLTRTISDISTNSEKPSYIAEILFKLIDYLKPKVIFDLGTSFGITTLYQASVNKRNEVLTFEGCPETAKVARDNFRQFNSKNITLIEGNIDITLAKKVNEISKIDYVFFDANHRYEPTIKYFETCLAKAHEDSIFIFDDIHWSDEMEKAWKYIKEHPQTMITIDLFHIGIVFFRKKQPKQHYVLKF